MLQVDKLKILSESLVNSSSKAETRILDHRYRMLFQDWLCICVQVCIPEIFCVHG